MKSEILRSEIEDNMQMSHRVVKDGTRYQIWVKGLLKCIVARGGKESHKTMVAFYSYTSQIGRMTLPVERAVRKSLVNHLTVKINKAGKFYKEIRTVKSYGESGDYIAERVRSA